jgi:hypothetical protein
VVEGVLAGRKIYRHAANRVAHVSRAAGVMVMMFVSGVIVMAAAAGGFRRVGGRRFCSVNRIFVFGHRHSALRST